MRKVFLIAIIFGGLAITSCKKDWVCECDFGGKVNSQVIKDKSKNHAMRMCKSSEDLLPPYSTGIKSCDLR